MKTTLARARKIARLPQVDGAVTLPTLDAVRAEQARRLGDKAASDFRVFLRAFAWPVLWPATPFLDNWHIGAVSEHLTAVTLGQIKRLIINIPFRSLKSTLVSQAWPAWEWVNNPSVQYLTASYARDLATRDAVNSRRIIEGPGYQTAFGDRFRMTGDQNVKTRYENDKAGSRTVTSTDGGATGFGGNRIVWDDPIGAMSADSEVARLSAIEFYKGTIATRLNNPAGDAIVLVMQRLHGNDPTGYILRESGEDWTQLVLPMRYERQFTRSTSLGFVDPRTKDGELLHPERLGEADVVKLEKTLGSYHTDAQLQQRPSSRAGIIFKRANWKFYKTLPQLDENVLSLDAAFKDLASSDYVSLQVWGRAGANKYLLHRVRDHLGFSATLATLRAVHPKFATQNVAILIEDKANGSAIIETVQKELPGVIAINPEGGKIARAYAVEPEQEAGNIWLPDPSIAPWIEDFISEVSGFPGAPNDDDTDAFTQAINWLKNRYSELGLLEFMAQQVAAQQGRKAA